MHRSRDVFGDVRRHAGRRDRSSPARRRARRNRTNSKVTWWPSGESIRSVGAGFRQIRRGPERKLLCSDRAGPAVLIYDATAKRIGEIPTPVRSGCQRRRARVWRIL